MYNLINVQVRLFIKLDLLHLYVDNMTVMNLQIQLSSLSEQEILKTNNKFKIDLEMEVHGNKNVF